MLHCSPGEIESRCPEGNCELIDDNGESKLVAKLYTKELVDIKIDMAPDDWELLRAQYRSTHELFGSADCNNKQLPKPYTYFPSTVTIDGNVIENSTVRKKGLIGSQSTLKPSLKVRFDHIDTEQRYLDTDGFALNNLKSDGSNVRSCLTYKILEDNGIPSSRCTFAKVEINDEPFGVFALVEEVKKPFLQRTFGDDEGNLYEGTVNDFKADVIHGFEQDTNERSDPSRADLAKVLDIVESTSSKADDSFIGLDTVFNLDAYYKFWAAEILISHRDGYAGNTNNFYIYANPNDNGRFHFIPWGVDFTLRRETRVDVPKSLFAFGKLPNLLYQSEESRIKLFTELNHQLETGFDEEELLEWADHRRRIIEPFVRPQDLDFFHSDFVNVRESILVRRKDIADSLKDGHPEWTAGLRGSICRPEVGSMQGRIRVNWDSLQDDWWESALDGEFAYTIDGQPASVVERIGARAGVHEATGRKWIRILYNMDNGYRYTFSMLMPDPRFFDELKEGETAINYQPAYSTTVSVHDLNQTPALLLNRYQLGEGFITGVELNTEEDGVVEVTFDAKAFQLL